MLSMPPMKPPALPPCNWLASFRWRACGPNDAQAMCLCAQWLLLVMLLVMLPPLLLLLWLLLLLLRLLPVMLRRWQQLWQGAARHVVRGVDACIATARGNC
jgi:hypothetical protein